MPQPYDSATHKTTTLARPQDAHDLPVAHRHCINSVNNGQWS
jgi:hypothetical protein